MNDFFSSIGDLIAQSGFANGTWLNYALMLVSFVLMYLAIVKNYEPLLLLPIAFGMFLANLPMGGMMHAELWEGTHVNLQELASKGGLLDFLYLGVKLGIYPPIIFSVSAQ